MFKRLLNLLPWLLWSIWMLTGSAQVVPPEGDLNAQLEPYIRDIRFDFAAWILDASWLKFEQAALGSPYYFDRSTRKHIVAEYLRLTRRVIETERELNLIYADPDVDNPLQASTAIRTELVRLTAQQQALAPFSEAILEDQVSAVLAESGLTSGGQPLPRLLYHISPLPLALIISPRDAIRQDANISLLADLSVDQIDTLENEIAAEQNVSALVVPVGGIGIYPTMGMRTTDLHYLVNTMAHEWTHNYLTWHPLGLKYGDTPALRTINETTASIVGTEVGQRVMEEYYPELLRASPADPGLIAWYGQPLGPGADPPPFDFNREMHRTRLHVDELLAAGKVDEAEAYMEQRREVFWQHGYGVRKLNQAYFAFYGAYADVPGGAAGTDPVGPAVRALRAQSASLADFVHAIMWVKSFDELQALLK